MHDYPEDHLTGTGRGRRWCVRARGHLQRVTFRGFQDLARIRTDEVDDARPPLKLATLRRGSDTLSAVNKPATGREASPAPASRRPRRIQKQRHVSCSASREHSIPVSSAPPPAFANPFSRSECGQIFPLFSRVMRAAAEHRPCREPARKRSLRADVLQPDDCACLVNRSIST